MKDKVIVTLELETNATFKGEDVGIINMSQVFDDISKTEAYRKHIEIGGIYVLDSLGTDEEKLNTAVRKMIVPEIYKGPEYVNTVINNNDVYNVLGVIKKIDTNTETVDVEISIDKLKQLNTYLDNIPSKEIDCHGKILPIFFNKGYYIENDKLKLYIDDECYIPYARLC